MAAQSNLTEAKLDTVEAQKTVAPAYNIDGEELREQLQACLDGTQRVGKFFLCTSFPEHVSPGLSIKNTGAVGLPLSHRDAQAIAEVCRKSPFGKKDKTVIDESVRKTWELDATEFECRNPKWTPYLDRLAQKAMQDLGVEGDVMAQPYKLLLYEEWLGTPTYSMTFVL